MKCPICGKPALFYPSEGPLPARLVCADSKCNVELEKPMGAEALPVLLERVRELEAKIGELAAALGRYEVLCVMYREKIAELERALTGCEWG